jgi:hypothetical protein
MGHVIDRVVLERFEAGLNPLKPELSMIPASIIGYGEMSTIFSIQSGGMESYACKRMPIFRTRDEMVKYEALYNEYNSLLRTIGLNIPEFDSVGVFPEKGNLVIYDVQKKLPGGSICNRMLHTLGDDSIRLMVVRVLQELAKVFRFNRSGDARTVGIDGQISNWAVKGWTEGGTLGEGTELFYIDTSTPFLSKGGVEQMDPELFLRSTPSFMVWLIRLFFLKGVMTRYYDFRLVTIDLVANIYKEQRPELVPMLVEAVNGFFAGLKGEFDIAPVTVDEVQKYYREDSFIWKVYLALRKFDRFLHLKLLRKPYPYILPGEIKR